MGAVRRISPTSPYTRKGTQLCRLKVPIFPRYFLAIFKSFSFCADIKESKDDSKHYTLSIKRRLLIEQEMYFSYCWECMLFPLQPYRQPK